MCNLESIEWNELISFNNKTPLKKRPIIIIDLQDKFNRKYNAIVVKYDSFYNVHVRYLDNPNGSKYWWTGNKDNKSGLDTSKYEKNKFFFPYVENGYDDIINYKNEPNRFFKKNINYPYLDGLHGNVYAYKFFKEITKNNKDKNIENIFKKYLNCNEKILFSKENNIFGIVKKKLNIKDDINIKFFINLYINQYVINLLINKGYDQNNIIKLKQKLKMNKNIEINNLFLDIISIILSLNINYFKNNKKKTYYNNCSNNLNILEYKSIFYVN